MGQVTEAEGLLRAGAMYPRRLGLRREDGSLALCGVKHGGFAVYVDDAPFYHFDLDGRWQRLLLDGVHFLKGLDSAVDRLDRVRVGENLILDRQRLDFAGAADLDARVRDMALNTLDDLAKGRLGLEVPEPPGRPIDAYDLTGLLEMVASWDADAWFRQRELYIGTYGPIGFIPPDCVGSLILQPALGNARGRSFGGGYGAEAYTRTASEFRQHAREVRKLMGRRLLQCRTAYLGGADAFRREPEAILEDLQTTLDVFRLTDHDGPVRPVWLGEQEVHVEAIHGFLEDFRGPLPSREDWKRFQACFLKRMTLGVESGDEGIREKLGSEWANEELVGAVREMKEAGLKLSLAVLVGMEAGSRHVEKTGELVSRLDLGEGDRIFLIEARQVGGKGFAELAKEMVGAEEVEREREGLRERWGGMKGKGVQVLNYTMEKQR